MDLKPNYEQEVKALQKRLITLPDHQYTERAEIRQRLLNLINQWNKFLNSQTTQK